MASLTDYIKKSGGKVNYTTPGNGTPQHLAMELFKPNQHLDVLHVPYKGIQGALTVDAGMSSRAAALKLLPASAART